MRLAILRWVYRWSTVASLLLVHVVLTLPIVFPLAWFLRLPMHPMIWMFSAIFLVQLAWAISIDWKDQRS